MSRQVPSDLHLHRYMFPTQWRLHTEVTLRSSCDIEASPFHLMLKHGLTGHRFSVIYDLRIVCLREAVILNGCNFRSIRVCNQLQSLLRSLRSYKLWSYAVFPRRPRVRSCVPYLNKNPNGQKT